MMMAITLVDNEGMVLMERIMMMVILVIMIIGIGIIDNSCIHGKNNDYKNKIQIRNTKQIIIILTVTKQ